MESGKILFTLTDAPDSAMLHPGYGTTPRPGYGIERYES